MAPAVTGALGAAPAVTGAEAQERRRRTHAARTSKSAKAVEAMRRRARQSRSAGAMVSSRMRRRLGRRRRSLKEPKCFRRANENKGPEGGEITKNVMPFMEVMVLKVEIFFGEVPIHVSGVDRIDLIATRMSEGAIGPEGVVDMEGPTMGAPEVLGDTMKCASTEGPVNMVCIDVARGIRRGVVAEGIKVLRL